MENKKRRGIIGSMLAGVAAIFAQAEKEKVDGGVHFTHDPMATDSTRRKTIFPIKKEHVRIPKGHRAFEVDGKTVYALNYKNAVRKCQK